MLVYGLITHNNSGGAQAAMVKLKQFLKKFDVNLEIIFLYGKKENAIRNQGTILVDNTVDSALVRYFLIIYRLFHVFCTRRPKAVIAFLPLATTLGLLVAFFSGVKYRIASQRNPSFSYSSGVKLLDKIFGMCGFYSKNVVNSKSVKLSFDSYPRSYKDKLVIVNNAVDDSDVNSFSKDVDFLKTFCNKKNLILSVGRLTDQKRHDIAIKLMSHLPEDVELAIAGHGNRLSDLKKLSINEKVEHRVHFLGLMRKDEILALLHRADLYIQTTAFEGQSNALLEALAAGKAIVSSDIHAQKEVLTCSRGVVAGVLVGSDQPNVWAKHVSSILYDSVYKEQLENLAKARSMNFSPQVMAKGFYELIHG